MLRLHLAELRDSWSAWLGVGLTFVVVNAALVIPALTLVSGLHAVDVGMIAQEDSSGYTIFQVIMILMTTCVGGPVIGSATGLVVGSRRGSLARLALAGAAPGQIRSTVTSQLIAVSLASAVVGDVLGALLIRPSLDLMAYNQRNEPGFVGLDVVWSPAAFLGANLLCVLLAVLGGARQARRASRTPAVEALRQAAAPRPPRLLLLRSLLKALLPALAVAGSWAAIAPLVENRNKETISNLLVLDLLQIFLCGALMAALTPVLVPLLTRAWTALVPSRDPAWVLARSTVTARADRAQRSLVPVMFGVGIAVAELGAGGSISATLEASGLGADLTTGDLGTFIMMAGPPLAIAFAGSVGALIMMGRQRDAELALLGVSGATPGRRAAVPVLEAVIITVSAALLSLGMILPTYAYQAVSLSAAGLTWRERSPGVRPWPRSWSAAPSRSPPRSCRRSPPGGCPRTGSSPASSPSEGPTGAGRPAEPSRPPGTSARAAPSPLASAP